MVGRLAIRAMSALALTASVFAFSPLYAADATSAASPEVDFTVQVADSDTGSVGNTLATARYTFALSGMLSGSQIALYLDENPVSFASGVADGAGSFTVTTPLPSDLAVGGHQVFASGTTASAVPFTNAIASLNVSASGNVTPGSTGDGTLSLVIQEGASAVLGSAQLVNNVSTSTGTLGQISVNDQRTMTKQGWTLYADVTNFALSTDNTVTIPKTQLGTAPQLITGSTEASGISLGQPTSPGTATYPMIFAEAASQAISVGHSTFDAGLIFSAPPEYPVGTYNATVTITLVSK